MTHSAALLWAVMQNAACVALFPAPVPLPGYYGLSLTNFQSCVPASACLGVDASAVQAVVTQQLAGSPGSSGSLHTVYDSFMALTLPHSNASTGHQNGSNAVSTLRRLPLALFHLLHLVPSMMCSSVFKNLAVPVCLHDLGVRHGTP